MDDAPGPVHARTGHSGRPVVVLGLLGTTLDRGTGPNRWNRWRPTVSVCSQPDLLVDRFELLHQRNGPNVEIFA